MKLFFFLSIITFLSACTIKDDIYLYPIYKSKIVKVDYKTGFIDYSSMPEEVTSSRFDNVYSNLSIKDFKVGMYIEKKMRSNTLLLYSEKGKLVKKFYRF
jgi:hypothetical protein